MRTGYDTAAADPAAGLVFAPVDPDAVAARYERASGEPLPAESLIQ
jgi:hypothetical protein